MTPRLRLAAACATIVAASVAVPSLADSPSSQGVSPQTTTDGCVTSVPDMGSSTPQQICYSLFKPAGADSRHRVPMVLHSHGWGGSRTKDASSFKAYLDAGYGVLSFDQRGFGQSGGKARIENPAFEGQDVARLVDLVSKLSWVVQDGKGDPRLGSIGGSYGGGYQFVGAFTQIAQKHKQVFDAMAPEITWWDLKESLAPLGVAKTEWDTALTAAGAQALPPEVLQGFAESAATGTWSDGSNGTVDLNAFFAKNGPRWQVSQGRRIDVPVLFRQGITDELFPLDQGLKNFAYALTPKARSRSIFVGYNGGHVLPNAFPLTVQPSGDPCSAALTGGKTFTALTIQFFDRWLKHKPVALRGLGAYHLATATGTCTTTKAVTPSRSFPVASLATPELAGPPMSVKVADGPIRVAGTPYVTGSVTALGLNNRAFYALGVGTSALDVKVVQGNMLPWAAALPVNGEHARIELPSVAVDVPKGQSLFLVAAATNDMYLGFGSRTPGVVVLDEAKVALPLVR